MPATIVPVKDCVFKMGVVEWGLDDVTLELDGDLVDISVNSSPGGSDELWDCFRRATVTAKAPWRVGGMALTWGLQVDFVATIVPVTCEITVPMKISNIKMLGKAKDVWRCEVTGKSSGDVTGIGLV